MMILICIMIIACIFFGDLWIKNRIEQGKGERRKLLNGKLILSRYHNYGAFLNLGEHQSKKIAALSVLLSIFLTILFLISLGHCGNNRLRAGLSLLLGGAFSNTYDRLKRRYVVDYLSFGVRWKRFSQIVFNLSDFCIMLGALIACLRAENKGSGQGL